MNLYQELGVSKTASKADIKRAYRKRAKRAHPDAGGSASEFERLSKIYGILGDDRKRLNYDRTGAEEADAVDNSFADALQLVTSTIEHVLAECSRRGIDPLTVDIIGDAIKTVKIRIAEVERSRDQNRDAAKRERRVRDKFKAKGGKVNRITPMIEARIQQFEFTAEQNERVKVTMELAIAILKDHTFDYSSSASYSQQSSSTSAFTQLFSRQGNW